MMLLRGVARRRPCGLSLRQFCAAVDVSSAQRPEEVAAGASSDVIRHVSVRESNRSRTRARVEGQLRGFLRSYEEWSEEEDPPREAYWLLRSCGSGMLLETTATRMELTHSMWAEFQKRGRLPVAMYNTLLQVFQQNGHRFDPAHFLEEMEAAGTLPNQGTLVGILSCCCEEGDIDGATKILDQMRSLDMEISEEIYAALITGHCRRGDMESAKGMLSMMSENGMSPTATSYRALLCGHADRGEMDQIEQVLDEMREKRVFPSVATHTAIMDRLSLSNHSDQLHRALDLVPDKQLLYNDLYDLACKFTVRRDNKGTLVVLRCLATLVPRATNMQLGAILIRTMATQGRPLAELMVMVSELRSLGFDHHVYEEVLHSLHCHHDDREQAMNDALTVLREMLSHGVLLKEHYFYPNLAYTAEKGDLEGVVMGVTLMKEAGLKLRRISFQYLLQAAKKVGGASEGDDVIGDMDRLLDHIKGTPLATSLANEVGVFLLDRGMFARAVSLLTSANSDPVDLGPILKAIKNGVNGSKVVDMQGLVGVYVALKALPSNPDLSRSVAITTTIMVQRSSDLAKQFIEELSRNGVEPGEHAYHTLLHSYATPETAKEFHSMVKSLQSRGLVLRPSIHKQMLQLAADLGDPVRAGQAVSAIRRSGEKLSATAFSRYIVANTKSRRIGTALELYERMRSHDLRPSYEAMNHLMVELLRWGDVSGAENLRRDLEELEYFPGLVLRNAFIGAYARRDMTKALEEFDSLKESGAKPTSFTYNELMVGYSLHGDTESIRGLFDELQREGIPLDRGLISRLFDAYITRGDFDGALSLVDEFPSLPPHASSLSAAMQRAMEDGDDGRVESVRVRMREISGERNTDNVMFFGYARVGQIMQTTSILEKEGFSLNARDLLTFVVDMKRKRKREEISVVLEMLRGKGHHLGDRTTVAWLRVYDILGDVESAVLLKAELEAADHTLSDEFFSRLETMTQSHSRVRERQP